MATNQVVDVNAIITENDPAPNPTAANPVENAANAAATDVTTPRARTRSLTAAQKQKVVKRDLKFYMDRANLQSVESIINNMCNIIEDGTYYFHREIVALSKITHKGRHELAEYDITAANKKKRETHIGVAMGLLRRDENCKQGGLCSGADPCKHFLNNIYIGIGNRYIRTAAKNIMELYRNGELRANQTVRALLQAQEDEDNDSEVTTAAAVTVRGNISREDTVELQPAEARTNTRATIQLRRGTGNRELSVRHVNAGSDSEDTGHRVINVDVARRIDEQNQRAPSNSRRSERRETSADSRSSHRSTRRRSSRRDTSVESRGSQRSNERRSRRSPLTNITTTSQERSSRGGTTHHSDADSDAASNISSRSRRAQAREARSPSNQMNLLKDVKHICASIPPFSESADDCIEKHINILKSRCNLAHRSPIQADKLLRTCLRSSLGKEELYKVEDIPGFNATNKSSELETMLIECFGKRQTESHLARKVSDLKQQDDESVYKYFSRCSRIVSDLDLKKRVDFKKIRPINTAQNTKFRTEREQLLKDAFWHGLKNKIYIEASRRMSGGLSSKTIEELKEIVMNSELFLADTAAHGNDEEDDIAAAYLGKTEVNKNKNEKKAENKQKNNNNRNSQKKDKNKNNNNNNNPNHDTAYYSVNPNQQNPQYFNMADNRQNTGYTQGMVNPNISHQQPYVNYGNGNGFAENRGQQANRGSNSNRRGRGNRRGSNNNQNSSNQRNNNQQPFNQNNNGQNSSSIAAKPCRNYSIHGDSGTLWPCNDEKCWMQMRARANATTRAATNTAPQHRPQPNHQSFAAEGTNANHTALSCYVSNTPGSGILKRKQDPGLISVEAQLNGIEKEVIIDTGATLCIISGAQFDTLGIAADQIDDTGIKVKGLTNASCKVKGQVSLPIRIKGHKIQFTHPFHIMEGANIPVLIGSDFLNITGSEINLKNKTWTTNYPCVEITKIKFASDAQTEAYMSALPTINILINPEETNYAMITADTAYVDTAQHWKKSSEEICRMGYNLCTQKKRVTNKPSPPATQAKSPAAQTHTIAERIPTPDVGITSPHVTPADLILAARLLESRQYAAEYIHTGMDDIEILQTAGRISDSSHEAYPAIQGVKKKKYYKRVYVTQSSSSEDDSSHHGEESSCYGSEKRNIYTGTIRKRHNSSNVSSSLNYQTHNSHRDNDTEAEEIPHSQIIEFMMRIEKKQKEDGESINKMLNTLAKSIRTKMD